LTQEKKDPLINKDRIQELISKALAQTATPEELSEIEELLEKDTEGIVSGQIEAFLQNQAGDSSVLPAEEKPDAIAGRILDADKPGRKTPVRILPFGRRLAAAAAVIIVIGSATFFWLNNHYRKNTATEVTRQVKNDASPGGNKALLILADGTRIVLDSAANGILAQQGETRILKTGDGKLAYRLSEDNPEQVLFNTVSTPRGGQFQITLPDGTKVWLNAATSLRFPTAFAANERIVELTGEAYFEVQKDRARPFTVKINDASVRVLGTHFNVMAYSDEEEMKTTLLEGSVKVTKAGSEALLTPGQQAVVKGSSQVQIIKEADTDEAIAWKNGYFQFSKIDEKALRQVSRWYNVDVVYEGRIREKEYSGKIDRNVKLSNVLEALRLIGINCKLENNKLVVMP
jgi:transmembrane sensor